jgi:hypothetical protein
MWAQSDSVVQKFLEDANALSSMINETKAVRRSSILPSADDYLIPSPSAGIGLWDIIFIFKR